LQFFYYKHNSAIAEDSSHMERHELYGGQTVLSFNPKNHRYRVTDPAFAAKSVAVPSVTGICGMKDKSRVLIPWAVGCTVDFFRKHIPAGVQLWFDEIQLENMFADAANANRNISGSAASVGSLVHAFAEAALKGENPSLPVNQQALAGARAFLAWLEHHDVQPLFVERKIYSRRFHVAGTVDFVGLIDGLYTVADVKTSKGVFDEMFLQTSAYQDALEEELGHTFDQRAILRCDKETGAFEYAILPDTHQRDLAAFAACRTLYDFNKAAWEDIKALKEAA